MVFAEGDNVSQPAETTADFLKSHVVNASELAREEVMRNNNSLTAVATRVLDQRIAEKDQQELREAASQAVSTRGLRLGFWQDFTQLPSDLCQTMPAKRKHIGARSTRFERDQIQAMVTFGRTTARVLFFANFNIVLRDFDGALISFTTNHKHRACRSRMTHNVA